MQSERAASPIPVLRSEVPSLKRLCVEVLVAHPDLPCPGLPDDLRDELARFLFFTPCLLGAPHATGPPAATALVLPLWKGGGAAEDADWPTRLAYVRGFVERFLGCGRASLAEAWTIKSVAAAPGRSWENERHDAVVEVEGRDRLRCECRQVAAGHWNVTALQGVSLMQELAERLEPPLPTFLLVVTDAATVEPREGRQMAVLAAAELLRPAEEMAQRLAAILSRLSLPGQRCEEAHCPLSPVLGGAVPCPRHLAALQRVLRWEGAQWLRRMREACPWDADLFERLEEEAEGRLREFLRAQREAAAAEQPAND